MLPILIKDLGESLIPFTPLENALNIIICIFTLCEILFLIALIIAILSNRRGQPLDNDTIFILHMCLGDLVGVAITAVVCIINNAAHGWYLGKNVRFFYYTQ